MNQALWVAKTGLDAQQFSMNSITNNLANVNTVGYKKGRAVFESLLYQNVKQAGSQSSEDATLPSGLTQGTGVKTVATQKDFSQGNVIQTNNPLDVMVEGRGFFQVLTPDGNVAYTRDGEFQVSSDGQIVTANGNALASSITVPSGVANVSIGSDGTVSALGAGDVAPSQIGTIELSDFINPAGLQPIGGNLYLETAASGSPQSGAAGSNGLGSLRQGSLESSNVNVVEELVGLIETQRAYEMNSKAISAIDNMMQYSDQVL